IRLYFLEVLGGNVLRGRVNRAHPQQALEDQRVSGLLVDGNRQGPLAEVEVIKDLLQERVNRQERLGRRRRRASALAAHGPAAGRTAAGAHGPPTRRTTAGAHGPAARRTAPHPATRRATAGAALVAAGRRGGQLRAILRLAVGLEELLHRLLVGQHQR